MPVLHYRSIGLLLTCVLLCWIPETSAAEGKPAKGSFHLYLLVGQSNMAGRGKLDDQDKEPHPRVLTLTKEGKWVPAVDPIHFDKRAAGVGLGRSFGIALAEADQDVTIGLIPCAAGGSPIASWQPGASWKQTRSKPYDDAIRRAKLAMQDGVLKGILWHQGESDCRPDRAAVYEQKLIELIGRFRKDLDAGHAPFIIGQLGQFPERPWNDAKRQVDQAHRDVAKKLKRVGFVPSDQLNCKSDKVHFNAESLREFGRRYARVFRAVNKRRN